MAERIWFRSLYWRIALGFVALVAVLLTVQVLVSLWLAGRVADLLPGRSPSQFAEVVAGDLSAALESDPQADVEVFMREHHGRAAQAWAVVLPEAAPILSTRVVPPAVITRAARLQLVQVTGGEAFGEAGAGRAGDGETNAGRRGFGGRGGRGRGGGRGGGPTFEFATILSPTGVAGVVAVPAELPPLSAALRGLGPTLAAVGLVLLIAGTAVAALVVFRPAHRRLRGLETAARALGSGETTARAEESGGDEVASLARTFNEMARDLDARARALVEADRTRRQLLADISHELATPLAAIRGYAETLSMDQVPLDEPTRRRYLQVITDETERLGHLVGDLLDLARLEGGGAPLKRDAVPVAALLERVASRHEPELRSRGVTLELRCAADTPDVEGDTARLEQALQNLAANAVRHTPAGGTVTITAGRQDDDVRIDVEDTGPGIPPEHLPRVFDRFYKVDVSRTGTETPSGSGLGLSIVQAIVSRHGGRVEAFNRDAGGARFEVVLPCAGSSTRQL